MPRNPNSLLAVAASLFPLTAPLVLLVRVVVSEVPAWQVMLSQILLWGSSLALLFRCAAREPISLPPHLFELRAVGEAKDGQIEMRCVLRGA
ncbi:MAG: hypothetical protein U0401_13395 [Anaerolineae bacterium]